MGDCIVFAFFFFQEEIIQDLKLILSLVSVIGCEGECERGKRPIMAKIATDKSDVSILTSDNPRKEDPCKFQSTFYEAFICMVIVVL